MGFQRRPVQSNPAGAQKARGHTFPAPVRGLILNENLAAARPGGALTLENLFPTQTGIRLRAGSTQHATTGSVKVQTLMPYVSGSTRKLFAADATKIFEITSPASPTVAPSPVVIGQTSGYYSHVPFETAGGNFLYAVNGEDHAQLYDGADFHQITGLATFGLAYDAQSGEFAVGLTVTGGTSGATATITAIDDDGATGTLSVQSITGTFQDNETITDTGTGSATSNIPSGVTTIQGVAITGVDTSDLSAVWKYRNRLYFVKKDTATAWYLPVDSLGGAATEVSLRGIFQLGGDLLFGATWSLDAGDGVDDKTVFVSTMGEIAVYEGDDPAASNWRLVGVYEIGEPLGKKGTMQAGGDLLVATKKGMVPVSAAITKDPAVLSVASVTRNIEPRWRTEVQDRGTTEPWELLKWEEKNLGIVSLPTQDNTFADNCLVVNLETGAWCVYTGWDVQCMAVSNGQAYFGTSDGKVLTMETGGSDNGNAYVCKYSGLFDHVKTPGQTKTVQLARASFTSARPFTPKVSVAVDYAVNFPAAPSATAATSSDVWDTGLWDVAKWSSTQYEAVSRWEAVSGVGFVVSPQLQVSVSSTLAPETEMAAFDIMFQAGGVVV